MVRLLHRLLTDNRITSRLQRALVHRVKKLLYMPDGYYSMGQIYRKIKPAAILDIGAHHGYTVEKNPISCDRVCPRRDAHGVRW